MKIIKTQSKKQQKMPKIYVCTLNKIAHKNSILYSELAPLTRDLNTLQTLEIRGKSR